MRQYARLGRHSTGITAAGLLLYGSQAREEAREDSDADQLELLRVLAPMSVDLYDRYGERVSLQPVSADVFARGATSFARTV